MHIFESSLNIKKIEVVLKIAKNTFSKPFSASQKGLEKTYD
eukprot:UN18064